MSEDAKKIAELESDLGYLSTAVGTGFIPDQAEFHDETIARRAVRAANAHKAAGQRDELLALLRGILNGNAGRQVLSRLDDGQSTETVEGKLWLAAREIINKNPV